MRTDENGVQHPTGNDPVTPENDDHISGCRECQVTFPVAWWMIVRRSARP